MPIKEDHPVITTPDNNMILWKYMDMASFLSMLTSNSLIFSGVICKKEL